MRRTSRSPRRIVAGACPSVREGSSMRGGYASAVRSPWVMLACSFGRHEAPRIYAGRDADDATEVTMELTLVAESKRLRDVGDALAAPEQLPRARNPEM